MNLGQLTQ